MNPRCTREDLRVCINIPSYWSVKDDGSIGDEHFGEGDPDVCNFDSYSCDNCGEFFTKAEKNEDAWQEALDHLKVKKEA